MPRTRRAVCSTILVLLLLAVTSTVADTFSVATYNVENYLLTSNGQRPAKSDPARAKVRETLLKLQADVLALQEVGGSNALLELRASLKAGGLDYPHWEWVPGYDTNIQVAVLSRFPFAARRSLTNAGFLLQGRRFRTSRGIAEVDVQVTPNYRFTLFVVHLKSRRESADADHAQIRFEEARILREHIDRRLVSDPQANLLVAGDFNDLKESRPIRTILGRAPRLLSDLRPAEPNGDDARLPDGRPSLRTVSWTHFYAKEDTYSRIDYLFVSPGMRREWIRGSAQILALPNWGVGSDHRPVIARFSTRDRR